MSEEQSVTTRRIAMQLSMAVLATRKYVFVDSPVENLGDYIWAESPSGESIVVAVHGLVYVIKPEGQEQNSTVTGLDFDAVDDFKQAVKAAGNVTAYVAFINHPHGNYDKTLVTILPVSELERVASKGSRFVVTDFEDRLMFDFDRKERLSDGKPAEGVIEAILDVGPLPKPYSPSKS